jgi:hypothetical protein
MPKQKEHTPIIKPILKILILKLKRKIEST